MLGNWIKSVLRQIVIKIGIKPIISYLIGLLRDKVAKTPTKLDDRGVRVIEKINEGEFYDLKSIIMISLEELRELAKESDNKFDDEAVNILIRIVESDVITLEKFYDELVVSVENYARSTETPFDDVIPIAMREIKKEIFKR